MATISRDAVAFFDKAATHEVRVVAYTGPASYATGGDSLTPGELALGKIDSVGGSLTISNGTTVYWGVYNYTTNRILWYSATATEVPNATVLSGFTGRFLVFGK